jgi:DNA-binding transcriptional LysR family regulator
MYVRKHGVPIEIKAALDGEVMFSKHISLIQIYYFLAVSDHLSFTEAAKSLYISQPSLSKQIAILEREIGVQLFFRTKRTVRLTPAGSVLKKELNGVVEQIESAIEKCRQPYSGEHGVISVGCLLAMDTAAFLTQITASFREKYPNIKLIFERHSFKTLREKLINGSLDVVFTLSFEIDDNMGILYDKLFKAYTCVAMSTSHPLINRENLKLSDLKDENFLMISRDESPKGFDSCISVCRKHGFTPNIVKQLPNVESLLLSVEAGLGIALFDTNVRLHDTDRIKLIEIDDDSIDIVMAWKKENLNPAVVLFTDCVLNSDNEYQ